MEPLSSDSSKSEGDLQVNYQIVDALNDLSGHFRPLDDLMVFAAQYLIFAVFAILAAVLVPVVRRRDWFTVAQVGAVLLASYVLGLVAAWIHPEQRPFTTHHDIHLLVGHPAGQSFPSDHATASFAIAFAVLVFVSRRWGGLLLVLAGVISVARVYSGLHYAGDVLGSIAVVLLAVALVELVSRAAPFHGGSPHPSTG